jgi:hypothetical protein
MTTGTGLITTYDNTVPQKTMITDRIILADPYDITTMLALGLDNASKFQFVNTPGRTYEWLEDAYPAVSDAANATNLTNDSTTTTIVVTTGALFHVGDVVQIDSEFVWVASISSNTLTVVRNFGGTQATHVTTSVCYIRYSARLEGAASSGSPWTEVSSNTNCSTIFHKEVKVTRNDQLFPRFGMAGLKQDRIDKNMDQLMEQLNRLPYYGVRAAGTSSTARSSGGFSTFITTNATAMSSAALTRKAIDDEFQQIYAAGGKTDLILCDAWRAENIGGIMIKQLMHPITGQLVQVVVDRHTPAGNMYFLDTRYVGYITIDPFFYEELAKTGDFETGETIGEYGFVLAYNKAHSMLTSYSTSA